ncbi:hypothetical protein ONZ45_g9259 [Pleurotus djamor]|nr:hypothetical protein ONZ45_g9259 [Pleurotus djamor]
MGRPDVLLSAIQLENRHSHTLEKRFLFSLLGGILSAVPIVGPLLGTPLIMIDEAIAKAINKKKEAPQEAATAMDEAVDEIASLEALVAAGEVATSLAPEVDDASPSPYAPLRAALPSTRIRKFSRRPDPR